MKSMQLITKILIFNITFSILSAYKYIVIPSDKVVEPCPKSEGVFISHFFDIKFSTERTEDGVLMGNATVTWIYEKEINEPASFVFNIFKKKMGQWIQEPYVVYRTDTCKSMLDPNELFYPYFAQVNLTKCPPNKGTTYHLKTQKIQVEIDIPGRNHEGEYRGIFRFRTSFVKVCALGHAEVIRA